MSQRPTIQRVLLVMKNTAESRVLRHNLQQHGLKIVLYNSMENLWENIHNDDFNTMVVEAAMPGENGYQFFRKLKEQSLHDGAHKLLISERMEHADYFWSSEVGVHTLVAKPIELEQLVTAIQSSSHNENKDFP